MVAQAVDSVRNTTLEVEIDDVAPSELNPRKRFDEDALQQLAGSIRAHGLLEPLVVRRREALSNLAAGEWKRYELIAGERRWRAAKLAGLAAVPIMVREGVDDRSALELMLVENLQRQDLDAIEEAEGYRQLHQVLGLKQREIAEAVKRSQPAIANRLRLLELPEDVQTMIRSGELSPAHGVALCRWTRWPRACSLMAAEAGRNHDTSHSLESAIPYRERLVHKSVAANFQDGTYGTPEYQRMQVIAEACRTENCPDRVGGDYSSLCLRPECLAEKVEAAAKADRTQRREALKAARKGEDIPTLAAMPDDRTVVLKAENTPAGCPDTCGGARRGVALDGHGNRVVICTDPDCHRKLGNAARAALEAKRVARARERAEAIRPAIEHIESIGPREAALLALFVCDRGGYYKSFQEAFDRFGLAVSSRDVHAYDPDRFLERALAVDPMQLVRAAIAGLVTQEIAEGSLGYRQGRTPFADLYDLQEGEGEAQA